MFSLFSPVELDVLFTHLPRLMLEMQHHQLTFMELLTSNRFSNLLMLSCHKQQDHFCDMALAVFDPGAVRVEGPRTPHKNYIGGKELGSNARVVVTVMGPQLYLHPLAIGCGCDCK